MPRDKVDANKEWEAPYLVQRLCDPPPPAKGALGALAEAFSFGGGLVNGGLSKEAMQAIRSVWSWDYMGAAEYEWGIVPAALFALATNVKAGEVKPFSFELMVPGWNKARRWEPDEANPQKHTVFFIAPRRWESQVKGWIKSHTWGGKDSRTRDLTYLWESLVSPEDYHQRCVGGLDCTNGWLYFTRRSAFEGACELFGLKETD